jgi:GNAT superfamily N-acetyltransferase
MLAMNHEAYSDKRGLAVVCPGMPLWVFLPEDMSDEDIRSFFYACLKEIKTPFGSLVADERTARLCAQIFANERDREITSSEITAYYLPKGRKFSFKPVKGKLREAGPNDGELINEWLKDFYRETFEAELPEQQKENPPLSEYSGRLYIWQDAQPSAMAMLCGSGKGFAQINLVYTPPALRRKGYGASIIRTLSQAAQSDNNIPMLYTDTGNAAANAFYNSLGFAEAGRLVRVKISPQLKQRIELG